jgi:hypothetical protein
MSRPSTIPVVPKQYEDPKIISGFTYSVCDFQLSVSITFNVILLDTNSLPIVVKQVVLSGQDYAAWGNDDQYIVNYICNALNLTELTSNISSQPVSEPSTPSTPPVSEPSTPPVSEPSTPPVIDNITV